jgi:hypothetical protein
VVPLSAASSPNDDAQEDEPEYEFPVPDFDEGEWRQEEIAKAHMSFLSFGYGLVLGALARIVQLSAPGEWWVGFAPIVGGVATLSILLEQFGYGEYLEGWKSLLGNVFLLFFTGFAMWVLLSNPPFV